MTKHTIQRTLESYSLNRKVLHLGPNTKRSGFVFENNILISELNSYELIYNVNQYLFKANVAKSKTIIQAIYGLLSVKTKHVFLLYTNDIKSGNLSRITQNIWAFDSDAMANRFLSEMIEQVSWAKHSHLLELPINPDFSSPKWLDQFIDPYYYLDYQPILSRNHYHYHSRSLTALTKLKFPKAVSLSEFKRITKYNQHLYDMEVQMEQQINLDALSKEYRKLLRQKPLIGNQTCLF